ncbi:MAG: aminotransferase class V-fold PLP-dependent enzyme, partial [Chlorobia bacterium]|nr:aminotransferase class V-fold PLP-dependent enzyme [Fimbriimonadaceae bacterium]
RFLEFLGSKPGVRVIGRAVPGPTRLPTMSFVHNSLAPQAISDVAVAAGIGMRCGNFYSVRLLERMGIDPAAGVARASFAHYNTVEEVDRLIAALEPIL